MSLETVYKSRFSNEAFLLSNLPVYLEALAKTKKREERSFPGSKVIWEGEAMILVKNEF